MGKSDVEMEDIEKHNHDSRNNIQEPESKLHDGMAESKEENLRPAISVSEDAKINECGPEDHDVSSNEAKVSDSVMSDMEGQIDPKSEASEPTNAKASVEEQVNASNESGREELISKKKNSVDHTTAISAEKEKTDASNEMFVENPTNGGLKEEKSIEEGLGGENPVNHVVEEKPTDGFAGKKDKEIGNEDPNQSKLSANEVLECQDKDEEMKDLAKVHGDKEFNDELKEQSKEIGATAIETGAKHASVKDAANVNMDQEVKDELKELNKETAVTAMETVANHSSDVASISNQQEPVTPNAVVKFSPVMAGYQSGETAKTVFTQVTLPLLAESDDGTPEEQATFMREIESFYHERAIDFKAPKFYGQPLNCLKLWRSVIRLGGYDRVTGAKLWRQVGESFHPPKTCTTVSWTFRIFYEKSLLEYERHKTQIGELQFPVATPEVSGVDGEIIAPGNGFQGPGSGRARRDAAARAMQGWHTQGLLGHGEVGEPIVKDKNLNNMAKREKNLKSIGSMKQRRPTEMEHSIKAARTETSRQLVTSVVDIGQPADWVKINIRQTKDCFEVYALVPGLLREEVRVQSDPAGRLVITGQPEQLDNPWGITPFKKVVSLPARIDPLQTSAVVSLHGRLFVRVPFEQSNS